MCGDLIKIQLKIEDGKISNFRFDGDACAVATASASLLSEDLTNKSLQEALDFSKEELLELIGVELTTSRIKCATLALDTVKEAINTYGKSNK